MTAAEFVEWLCTKVDNGYGPHPFIPRHEELREIYTLLEKNHYLVREYLRKVIEANA